MKHRLENPYNRAMPQDVYHPLFHVVCADSVTRNASITDIDDLEHLRRACIRLLFQTL